MGNPADGNRRLEIAVDGVEVPADTVNVRSLNFGQEERLKPTCRYQLTVGIQEIATRLDSYYREFADDDAEHGSDDDPAVVVRLRELDWPDLETLAQVDPKAFVEFVRRYLAFELFVSLFRDIACPPAQYLLNTVDEVCVQDNRVVVAGDAIVMVQPRTMT